jgi:hypothetical protein
MQKWEYKILPVLKVVPKDFYQTLAKLGEEGWELVATTPGEIMSGADGLFFYFKRPLSDAFHVRPNP